MSPQITGCVKDYVGMKNTDFSSVKSCINDKTEKTHTWVCTHMTVHLQMKREPRNLPDGKTMRPLGVLLVPCFLLAIVQTDSQ